MVDRPYHDYSTSALCELSTDLASSQAQLEDQRADYVKRVGSYNDSLRQLDALISNLGYNLAAIDQELVIRHRERRAAASAHRGVTQRPGRVRRHNPLVMQANLKPHCRAKRVRALGPAHESGASYSHSAGVSA